MKQPRIMKVESFLVVWCTAGNLL